MTDKIVIQDDRALESTRSAQMHGAEDGRVYGEASPRPSTSTLVSKSDLAGVDNAYRAKSDLVNGQLTRIGMGKYQWTLFFLCGMGWVADNIVLQ